MQTSLQAIAKKAKENKQHRFGSLYELLNEELLLACWSDIRKDAAYGVDRVSAQEYEQDLVANIRALVERLKRKTYRAKPIRRQYIPKGNGRFRPLGILAVEDKLLQLAVTRILEAIYEQDFLRCSYGYRPNIGAVEAVDDLTVMLQFGRYGFVVEADIQGFFDNLDKGWLKRMLEERIEEQALLRLIEKWLRAGVLDTNGQVLHPATGTPQGAIVSPILANIYLHYALDLWFEKVVRRHCRGEARLIRFADDFVCAFEKQADAERFYQVLGKRLDKFGLALSMEKTRVLSFSRWQEAGKTKFDFLGFEFRWGKSRTGKDYLKRRTSRKKLHNSLRQFAEWCRQNRHLKLYDLFSLLNAKLRGYYNYYGVNGNYASLQQFFDEVIRILYKWLNRRSQRRSLNWEAYQAVLKYFRIERPRIVGRPKTRRIAVTT